MKRLSLTALIIATSFIGLTANAAGGGAHLKHEHWHFDGIKGTFDKNSIQRGFQVYREVCASCHAVEQLYFRNLEGAGFSAAEVKQLASEYTVIDGPDDSGDMFERLGRASDKIPEPFANEKAARASNGGAYPVDLSLIIKARGNGANYVFSLLTGYEDAPADFDLSEGKYYNSYYAGGQISMAPPLADDLVTYQDGTAASTEQMARDVVNFLQWSAEPEMAERKRMGLKTLLFLAAFTLLFYMAKKRIWARIK